MDGQNQQKQEPSLADTLERYSAFEGSTPREKIRNAYAQFQTRAASVAQPIEPSATPSSTGDIEPSVPVPIPETAAPLSVRVDRDTTHPTAHPGIVLQGEAPHEAFQGDVQTIQPSALSFAHAEERFPGSVHLGPAEFCVPLPMDSRVKDDYERVLTNQSHIIRDFLAKSKSGHEISDLENDSLTTNLREILVHLSNVATHPDLNIVEHIKDSDSDFAKEAAWAEYSSAKFLFLGYLVEFASSRDIHLVIMVNGERTQKVVERYLMGKGLVYTRPREEMGLGTNLEVSMLKGSLSLGIQSTQSDGVLETYKAPSAIIALDSSFNPKSPPVEHMRTTFARQGTLLPAIRLIVSNSSEHVELCFPNLSDIQALRTTIQYTIRLQDMVGDLQDDALGVQEDVEEILSFLLSDNFHASWPLPSIEPITIVGAEELDATSLGSGLQPSVVDSTPFPEISPQKRQYIEEAGEQIAKRIRMDLSQEPTQLTESSNFPSQNLNNDLQALEQHLVQTRTAHAAELEKLQKALSDAQSRLQEREKILESLQHRYESRTEDLHKTRQERDRLAESKVTSEQRLEKQKEEIAKLKDERTQLRHDLEQVREELKAGGGSAAELETAREEIRRLTKENASLVRKAEYESKQAEYTREQYQTASNVAAQSGNEVRQLREENESLKRKVAGDISHLRELNMKNDDARHLSRIRELEATLSSREDLLRRKEDELREIRRNRPSTRSTSTQPRSPRMNAGSSRPTSPGFGNNGSSFPGRGSALRFSSEMSL
ncbi:class II histone deacetylase complex subunits 2 and 3-domain-containing protein [Aspergillus floccosus]